ncbi:hypothetical protein CR513_51250, partial [Mucuna pruriens]
MKKLYHKGTVHPSPPLLLDQLSFLPAAILSLAAVLSPDDREILAYLLSFSGNPRRNAAKSAAETDHSPVFTCSCFGCYTSYWVRWDESPNRQLIHEIIDAYEDPLAQNKASKNGKGKKDKRNKKGCSKHKHKHSTELKRSELPTSPSSDPPESESVVENNTIGSVNGEAVEGVVVEEKGSVRRG